MSLVIKHTQAAGPIFSDNVLTEGHPLRKALIDYERALIDSGVAAKIDQLRDAVPDIGNNVLADMFELAVGRIRNGMSYEGASQRYEEFMQPIRLARETLGFNPLIHGLGYIDRPEEVLDFIDEVSGIEPTAQTPATQASAEQPATQKAHRRGLHLS